VSSSVSLSADYVCYGGDGGNKATLSQLNAISCFRCVVTPPTIVHI